VFPIWTVCPNSWPSARLFGTKFDGPLRPVDTIVFIFGTCYLELFSRPPTSNVWFRGPAFFGHSGAPDLDQTVAECLENLEERPRQQYLHRGKILRQSETAETQLFLAVLPIRTVCPNSWPSARLFGTKLDGQLRPVDAIVFICGTCYLELFSRPSTTNVWFRWPAFFGKSGEPDFDQTVEECLENLEERARQQYLHRGKILHQSETAKTQLFFGSASDPDRLP
jgi:hypothetical protein